MKKGYVRISWMVGLIAVFAISIIGAAVWAAEKKENEEKEVKAPVLTLAQLPAAVRATIEKESQGAKILGLEKENEDGKVQYSAELLKGKEKSEIAVAEDGKFLGRELLITLKQTPKAVQAAMKKEAKGGKLGKEIEKGEQNGKPVYTANVTKGNKQYEVIFGEDGKLVKREAATEVKAAKKGEKDEDDEKEEKK